MTAPRIAVVGAGPAGIRAAETLVQAGLRPVVIDEGWRGGGQIYRRPPPPIRMSPRRIYGFDAARAVALHDDFDRLESRIDYRPQTLAWGASPGRLDLLSAAGGSVISWDYLILATGAMDRVLPFEGWTLPGVFTLGGAQIALKSQGCAIAQRPVFFGTGPLLYLVAWQYAKAGVRPAAVLDTAPKGAWKNALPGLFAGGRTFLGGAYYLAWLKRHGVMMASGIMPLGAEPGPDEAVGSFSWRDSRGRLHRTECDGIGFGFGLRSETALAELCQARFAFDAGRRQWLPVQDADGRAGNGLYLAGDGAGIRGAIAAELSGERAARAMLHDIAGAGEDVRLKVMRRRLGRRLERLDKFRAALEMAFPFPAALAASAEDSLMICRCEGVTAGALREAATVLGAAELNRAKALTRIGMGRCQGRMCGAAAAEILAAATGQLVEAVGRFRPQMPVRPVPLAALLETAA